VKIEEVDQSSLFVKYPFVSEIKYSNNSYVQYYSVYFFQKIAGVQMQIEYKIENKLSVDEFIDCLIDSRLANAVRLITVNEFLKMLKHANLIVTARDNGLLVGVSRSLSDFTFCTYLSDLAVRKNYQKTWNW